MKAINAIFWEFKPSKPVDGSELCCPECGEWSPLSDWSEVGGDECETCGQHDAMECPRCFEYFDMINSDKVIEVR